MSHETGPVELATTGELVNELERRFPLGMLVLCSRETPGDGTSERFEMYRRATITTSFGLLDRGRIMLVAQDADLEIDPEEDP